MIVRNDHMLRAIEQMAFAYSKAWGQTHDRLDHGAGLATVDNALAIALGTRAELLAILGTDPLDNLDPTLRAHAARLLSLRARILAELHLLEPATHALRLAHWAFLGLLDHHFEDEDHSAADHVERMLKHALAAEAFSSGEIARSYEDLFTHHASQQRYARAEDNLFHALATADPEGPEREQLREKGLAFYSHLLTLPDEMLHHGGLPRSEVEDARRELFGPA